MNRRRALRLLAGTSLLGGTVLGSGAFTSDEPQREVTASVVGDPDAYLKLIYPETKTLGCSGDVELRIGNQTGATIDQGMDVTLSFSDPNAAISNVDVTPGSDFTVLPSNDVELEGGSSFDSGDVLAITVTLSGFSGTASSVLSFDVEAGAGSDDFQVETDPSRQVTVDYDCSGPTACPVDPNITVDVGNNPSSPPSGGGDLTIDNENIDGDVSGANIEITDSSIDGSVDASGNIGTFKQSEVGGKVESGGDIGGTVDDVAVDGNLIAGNDIDIKNSTVAGKLEADGNIATFESTVVGGNVDAADDIGATADDVTVGGDLNGCNDIDITNSTICGSLDIEGNIATFESTDVGGDVEATNDIGGTVDDVHVFGDITGGNDIDITDSEVDGNVDAAGNVTITGTGPVVVGDWVAADGDVTINSGATLDGDVFAVGSFSNSGTHNGSVLGTDPR